LCMPKLPTANLAVTARCPGHPGLGLHSTEPVNSHLSDLMASLPVGHAWDERE
jgi:hypothetical protein